MNARIKELILSGEGESLDYKQTISSSIKIAKTMVAFANHKGGTLLVGVRDNKSIAGIRPEEEKYMLEKAASFHCKPEIKIKLIEHLIDDLLVLECIVPEGELKPYYAQGDDEKWWVYIRVRDKSLLASKVVMDVLKKESSGRPNIIRYGKNEEALLRYLRKNERITVNEFSKLVNISRRRANKIVVNLISAGVIRNHTNEKTEFFTLS